MMKIEQAMLYLREGHTIYRESKPEFKLRREENGLQSFYVSIYDILAEDWVAQLDLFPRKESNE